MWRVALSGVLTLLCCSAFPSLPISTGGIRIVDTGESRLRFFLYASSGGYVWGSCCCASER